MRERPWGPYRGGILAVGLASASLAACTLIAGIDDGVLVDAGPADGGRLRTDGANGGDGSKGRDGGKGQADATKGDAGAHDGGSTPDAKKGDGGKDTGPPPKQLTCAVVAGSKVTVDDLSRPDAGATTFSQGLYVTPNGGSNGFGVVTGTENDQVVAYTVDQQTVSPRYYAGTLVDVVTAGPTFIRVLTSAINPASGTSSLTLLSGTQPGSLVAGSAFGSIGIASNYQGGKAAAVQLDGGAGIAYATLTQTNSGPSYALGFGFAGGTSSPHDVYEADASFGFTNNAAFFATAGSLYALMNQIQPADAAMVADTVITSTDSLTTGGVAGTLAQPANAGALIGARASVTTPNEAILIGATVMGTGGNLALCTATVPPSMIKDLTLCGPGFTLGEGEKMADLSLGGAGGIGWNVTTDDLATLGPNGLNTAMNFAWLAPDARLVALVPSVLPTGIVHASAVQFDQFIGDNTGSDFDVAWIERNPNPEGGTLPDKLFAAVVNCE